MAQKYGIGIVVGDISAQSKKRLGEMIIAVSELVEEIEFDDKLIHGIVEEILSEYILKGHTPQVPIRLFGGVCPSNKSYMRGQFVKLRKLANWVLEPRIMWFLGQDYSDEEIRTRLKKWMNECGMSKYQLLDHTSVIDKDFVANFEEF